MAWLPSGNQAIIYWKLYKGYKIIMSETKLDIDDYLFALSPSKQFILNFMKSACLFGVMECLKNPSKENEQIAENIMNDVIEGYQFEEHSVQ